MNIFMYVKKKKKIFFGTNDPNKCEWGGMFPNFINYCFYGIFDHHIKKNSAFFFYFFVKFTAKVPNL